jgi:4,5-dihydroxyphthalate decarboxylase
MNDVSSQASGVTKLSIALGNYPHTKQLKSRTRLDDVDLDFADIKPVNRAFAPMVRDLKFDISEIAIVTFLQAKASGKALVLLPVTLAARFQEAALLCRTGDKSIAGPADLPGKRIGVRAYSQTTGVWIRGVLGDDFGISAEQIRWVTFEGAHVAEISDPAWTQRASEGQDMLAMLRDGELDAVIVGNDVPDDLVFRTVFPDPKTAADRFRAKHGFMPVNHMITVRASLVEKRPDLVVAFLKELNGSLVAAGGNRDLPMGRNALQPAVNLALRFSIEQGLVPASMTAEQVWEGLPAGIS